MKNKIIIIFLLLTSCGSFSDAGKALRNEKTVTTDEFLIERRGPLSIPPNMNELPKPKTKTNKIGVEKLMLKKKNISFETYI